MNFRILLILQILPLLAFGQITFTPGSGSGGGGSATGAYAAYSVSSAGNTNLSKSSAGVIQATYQVTAGAGGGAYTRVLSLDTSNCTTGDKAFVVTVLPASTNPTVEVRNASSGGTLLYTAAGTGAAFNLPLSFTFDGTSWKSDQ